MYYYCRSCGVLFGSFLDVLNHKNTEEHKEFYECSIIQLDVTLIESKIIEHEINNNLFEIEDWI
ncbi:MAG: hypothetical protein ABEK17_03740 [Candidatus Aenigmatarchaeota archaeon]